MEKSFERVKTPSPFEYMDLMFANQDKIYDFAATANDEAIIKYIADLVTKNLMVSF